MIANEHRGEYGIPGTEYVLRFRTNDFASAETVSGENIMSILSMDQVPPIWHMRLILWCGLRWQNPDITIDQAGDIMDDIGLAAMPEIISSAVNTAFAKGAEADEKKGKRSTG
jgi:hypothetical protein